MASHELGRRRFMKDALMAPLGAAMGLRWLRGASFAAEATMANAATANAGRRPNVLFIVSDDHGWGDLPTNWKNTEVRMPALGRIASAGARFPNYHTEPLCGPSRACMFTGQFSMENGMWRGPGSAALGDPNYRGVKRDVKMLPEFLKEAGYATAAVGKWHLGEGPGELPWERGFDDYWGFLGGAHPYWLDKACRLVHNGQPYNPGGHTTEHFTDKSIELIRAMAASGKPFFHYLAYNAVHGPMWTEEAKRASAPDAWLKQAEARGIELPRRDYVAILEHMDHCIGRLMESLRELKIEGNTLVIFVSDNGACLMDGETDGRFPGDNGPLRGGKGTTFQGGLNVPLLMQWHGRLPADFTSPGLVMHCDLFSTVLDAAGLATPAMNGRNPTRGMSLLPHLGSRGARTIPERTMIFELVGRVGLRKGKWKLWGQVESSRGDWKQHAAELRQADLQLFDLSQDVGETKDLRAAQPEVYASLKRELIDYFEHIDGEYPGAAAARAASEAQGGATSATARTQHLIPGTTMTREQRRAIHDQRQKARDERLKTKTAE